MAEEIRLASNEQLVDPGTAPRLWRWRVTEQSQENAIQVVLRAGENRFQYCAIQFRTLDFAQQRGDKIFYRYSPWQDVTAELE